MNIDIPIAPSTQQKLDSYINNPAAAILLYGPNGSGSFLLAQILTARTLGVSVNSLDTYPYFFKVERGESKSELTIAQVREVLSELAKTTTGEGLIRRVVVFKDAQHMNREAQNALLKTLEEPPRDTIILLTATNPSDMLPTIRSRMQLLQVESISLDESNKYFGSDFSHEEIQRAWKLSGGKTRLMHELLHVSDHPRNIAIDDAKKFVAADTFTRIDFVDKLSKDKSYTHEFLEALTVLSATLQRQSHAAVQSRRISRIQTEILKAKFALDSNAQMKLVLLRLATHI